jgi:hypothetical protein
MQEKYRVNNKNLKSEYKKTTEWIKEKYRVNTKKKYKLYTSKVNTRKVQSENKKSTNCKQKVQCK